MPINPDSIDRFLRKPVPWVPGFKGMDTAGIDNNIYACTGIDYKPHKPSRASQHEGTAFALYCRQSLLFFEPRVGKTKAALDWAEHLKRAGLWKGKGLVIAHAPVGVDVWESQGKSWSKLKITGIIAGRDPRQSFIQALEDDTDLIVISWGMLRSMFTVRRINRKDVIREYPDLDILRMVAEQLSLIIIDEIHYCKNHESLYFALASELVKHCNWRLGLTGTPVGRNAKSLWAQCYLIDEGATLGYNYHFFEVCFCEQRKSKHHPRGYVYVFDPDKMPLLLDKVSGIAMTYRLDEIQDIDVLIDTFELRMRGKQRQMYNETVEGWRDAENDDGAVRNAFVRMRQIASGFMPYVTEHGETRITEFEDNPKLEWLVELIEQLPEDLPLVIFHEFNRSGEMIENMLTKQKRKFVTLNGRTKDRSVIHDFQSGLVNILVANTRSGGEAIDLRRSEYLCFYESPCSPIIRKQAESRPLARGSRPLLINDLVCSPVEIRILEMIEQGRDLQQAVSSIRNVLQDKAK